MSLPKTIAFEVKSLGNLIIRCIQESAARSGLDGLTGVQDGSLAIFIRIRTGLLYTNGTLKRPLKSGVLPPPVYCS